MKTEIAQLYKAIGALIREDGEALYEHAVDKDYIKGVLRDTQWEEDGVQLQLTMIDQALERIKDEVSSGEEFSEYELQILNTSEQLLQELKIDHNIEERY